MRGEKELLSSLTDPEISDGAEYIHSVTKILLQWIIAFWLWIWKWMKSLRKAVIREQTSQPPRPEFFEYNIQVILNCTFK